MKRRASGSLQGNERPKVARCSSAARDSPPPAESESQETPTTNLVRGEASRAVVDSVQKPAEAIDQDQSRHGGRSLGLDPVLPREPFAARLESRFGSRLWAGGTRYLLATPHAIKFFRDRLLDNKVTGVIEPPAIKDFLKGYEDKTIAETARRETSANAFGSPGGAKKRLLLFVDEDSGPVLYSFDLKRGILMCIDPGPYCRRGVGRSTTDTLVAQYLGWLRGGTGEQGTKPIPPVAAMVTLYPDRMVCSSGRSLYRLVKAQASQATDRVPNGSFGSTLFFTEIGAQIAISPTAVPSGVFELAAETASRKAQMDAHAAFVLSLNEVPSRRVRPGLGSSIIAAEKKAVGEYADLLEQRYTAALAAEDIVSIAELYQVRLRRLHLAWEQASAFPLKEARIAGDMANLAEAYGVGEGDGLPSNSARPPRETWCSSTTDDCGAHIPKAEDFRARLRGILSMYRDMERDIRQAANNTRERLKAMVRELAALFIFLCWKAAKLRRKRLELMAREVAYHPLGCPVPRKAKTRAASET